MFNFLINSKKENKMEDNIQLKEIVVEKDNRHNDVVLNINYTKENIKR
jgi:hypothetical protein